MNDQEVRALLAAAVAYDNRKPSNANITAWTEASERGRWTFQEALEAVHKHYSTSTDFLMPGHITAMLAAERRQPDYLQPALTAAPPAEPERIDAAIDEVARNLHWDRKAAQSISDIALTVQCPHCHAGPNRPCTRLVTRGSHRGEHQPISQPHPTRREIAEANTP